MSAQFARGARIEPLQKFTAKDFAQPRDILYGIHDHADARGIAEAHRNKPWARRWLRVRGRL